MEYSNDQDAWQYLAEGYISKLSTPRFTGSSMSLSYPKIKARYIRATIYNQDDQSLTFAPEGSFKSLRASIIFKVEPLTPYTLYYGNPSASFPQYDLARIFAYLETDSLMVVSLGEEKLNNSYTPPIPPKLPFTDRNKYLLNTSLVLLVVIIGGLIYFYLRKTFKNNNGGDDTSGFVR